MIRRDWIEPEASVAVVRQCDLAGICRATVYAHQEAKSVDEEDLGICRLIDEEYTRHPFYGSRRMGVYLGRQGQVVS